MIRLDIIERRGRELVVAASSSNMSDILVPTFSNTPITEIRELARRSKGDDNEPSPPEQQLRSHCGCLDGKHR
jgi:hypothetical protein